MGKEDIIMLRVDYQALEEAARKLIQQGDTFEHCIKDMDVVIQGLPDVWEAETCDRYVAQFGEYKPKLEDVRELIADMAEQMTKISNNFRQADADMKTQMMK